MDPAITEFFNDRKEAWLKKKVTTSMDEIQIAQVNQECEEVFQLKNWLPNAAKRAGQITVSTHPCTFSHPSSRKNKNGYASSVIAKAKQANDGFLRSGNVKVEPDALGNAAALDVHKFLMLEMSDGQRLLDHFEDDSELARSLIASASQTEPLNYDDLKAGFLAMTAAKAEVVTSSKIKQVYFPLAEDESYHLLSILTPSGMIYDLRKRLDAMRFGDEIKQAREHKKTNQEHANYKEIYNLTTIGYGGTKPQNISVLNNQNGGKAHLLLSMPPQLQQRDIHFPRTDFFTQSTYYFQCKPQFYSLHALYSKEANNMSIRNGRDEFYQSIIDHIIEKMWQVRSVSLEQFNQSTNQLSASQKTWLYGETNELRFTTDDWLDDICKSITNFIFHGYEKVLAKKAIKLGDGEFKHMQKMVELNKEALR